MKQLNFTCKEKLSYLLNLKKGDELQTIRKAWKRIYARRIKVPFFEIKQPEHSKDDIVEYGWDLESEYEWFDKLSLDGKVYSKSIQNLLFNKNLGNIKITEVFEIEMYYKPIEKGRKACILHCVDLASSFSDRHKIAVKDGFKDQLEMFKWFDKKYDLSSPRKFYVYRGVKI